MSQMNNTNVSPTSQVEALLEEWKKDVQIDRTSPADDVRKIGLLHSKYLNILSTHRRALKENERKAIKFRRLKYEYYMGRLDSPTLEKYKWEPFPYTLKTGDLTTYMESDTELLNAKAVLANHEEIISVCESIMKELNNRTWQMKEICGWEKFISGVH
jgi:hypothetical protein